MRKIIKSEKSKPAVKNLKSLKKRARSHSVDALYITAIDRLTRNSQACA